MVAPPLGVRVFIGLSKTLFLGGEGKEHLFANHYWYIRFLVRKCLMDPLCRDIFTKL